ncbi:MAG: Druantia anti-phage system protein DruA [Pseudomonadota bacterium]
MHRTELADRLCDEFGFVDALDRRQRSGCLKSLRVLEKRGHFVLPTPRRKVGSPRPRGLASPVPPPQEVPGTVPEVRGLELVLVRPGEHMRVWNTLLEEHPRGAGPLVGRQLRYLIGSEHGWLGGIAFAAPALHLEARDRWIGWDVELRREHLDRVVGMSRLLIRPSVTCANLASRVLGLVMARMPQDFQCRYGYKPWLVETFVDTSAGYFGTCYRAANWTRVGTTQGRGRQDRERRREETVKDLYVYVLADDFRSRLGLAARSGGGPLPLGVGLESETWAKLEFGGARLGDERFTKRLVESATVQAENPTASFPVAADGNKAMIRGQYRLLDQPDESAVTMENILKPHREQTIRRMMAHKTVLCIQDGTDLNYNGATECQGLGVIGNNQTSAKTRGLHLHSTLVVSDEGLPLGLLRADCKAPKPRNPEDTRPAHEIPLEEKKTYT